MLLQAFNPPPQEEALVGRIDADAKMTTGDCRATITVVSLAIQNSALHGRCAIKAESPIESFHLFTLCKEKKMQGSGGGERKDVFRRPCE
jgi:hypothetical protein